MTRIAVYYHCILDGGSVPINTDYAVGIMAEQMHALKASGLEAAANEIVVGVNGSGTGAIMARTLAPEKAKVVHHAEGHSEIPTLMLMRDWLNDHEDWAVLYHHSKGCTHTWDQFYNNWRHCMERSCVWNWKECVRLLEQYDSVGSHWLTAQRFGPKVTTPFWGGTFFWATARFLKTLPPLPEPTWANRYEAESWIGHGPKSPTVFDFAPHWPGRECH